MIITEISFTEWFKLLSIISDSTVADFLSPLPSHVDLSGSAILGDGTYQGTIEISDFIFARVKIFRFLRMASHLEEALRAASSAEARL